MLVAAAIANNRQEHMERRMQTDTTTSDIVILVNGERSQTPACTLAELVAGRGFAENAGRDRPQRRLRRQRARAATLLGDGDKVEIVAPRQGG